MTTPPRTPTTAAGRALEQRLAYDRDPAHYEPGDFFIDDRRDILAIESEAPAPLDARYAAQLNLTIKANSTIEDLREELHAAHEHRRVIEEYMSAPDPAPLDVERLTRAINAASVSNGSYDWDWVLHPDAIAAIARAYEATR